MYTSVFYEVCSHVLPYFTYCSYEKIYTLPDFDATKQKSSCLLVSGLPLNTGDQPLLAINLSQAPASTRPLKSPGIGVQCAMGDAL